MKYKCQYPYIKFYWNTRACLYKVSGCLYTTEEVSSYNRLYSPQIEKFAIWPFIEKSLPIHEIDQHFDSAT